MPSIAVARCGINNQEGDASTIVVLPKGEDGVEEDLFQQCSTCFE